MKEREDVSGILDAVAASVALEIAAGRGEDMTSATRVEVIW